MAGLLEGADGVTRCSWSGTDADYVEYHDHDWGYPIDDDIRLFEKLTLESFQSGLSWRTILTKRENFRKAFLGFDFEKIAKFDESDVERLLQDEGIVRHRGKIEACINNAKSALEMIEAEGSLAAFFWRYEPKVEVDGVPSQTEESKQLSKDLKKRGWKFVGPTTVYAFMQAAGMVNDHTVGCAFYDEVEKARAEFVRP
jgi:DNA-3-methyladenine glycosylase I